MRLFSDRAIDYFRSANADDRRYLLFNPITKMKVTTEAEHVVALLGYVTWTRYSNIMPKGMYDKVNILTAGIGTGPYKLTEFVPDDHAIMTGFAEYRGQPVLLLGHVKGGDTKEKIFRNFGYARPEGYRKSLRAMRLA